MNSTVGVKADEVTYNTLLDGCARFGHWERGLSVLAAMQKVGIRPSNFTLSVLVKLSNRCRRPREAFRLTEEIAAKYNLRLNLFVYNNLIHACVLSDDFARGLQVFEQLLRE